VRTIGALCTCEHVGGLSVPESEAVEEDEAVFSVISCTPACVESEFKAGRFRAGEEYTRGAGIGIIGSC